MVQQRLTYERTYVHRSRSEDAPAISLAVGATSQFPCPISELRRPGLLMLTGSNGIARRPPYRAAYDAPCSVFLVYEESLCRGMDCHACCKAGALATPVTVTENEQCYERQYVNLAVLPLWTRKGLSGSEFFFHYPGKGVSFCHETPLAI